MSKIHKAYQVLGLDAGTPFESVKRRRKRLVLVWHPDRMTNNEGRHDAEEELKNINHNYDILEAHFEKDHSQGVGCECQPNTTRAKEKNTSSASSGASSQQRQEWETEQKRRQEEQARRAREERYRQEQEATWKAEEQSRAAEASKEAMQEAEQHRHRQQQEQLRWRIAAAIALAYLLVLASSWLIGGAKDFIAGFHAAGQSQSTKSATATPGPSDAPEAVTTTTDTSTDTGSYLPPQYHIPGKDLASCRRFYEEEGRRLHERQEQEHLQDISDATKEIGRHQKAIAACNASIADIQAKLWDLGKSRFDRQRLQWLLELRQHTLVAEQVELQSAQEKLNQLRTTEHNLSDVLSGLSSQPAEAERASNSIDEAPLSGGFFGKARQTPSSGGYSGCTKYIGETHG